MMRMGEAGVVRRQRKMEHTTSRERDRRLRYEGMPPEPASLRCHKFYTCVIDA